MTSAPFRQRQTKIVATLGPASATPALIRTLYESGADVFRLNFSHGTHADHAERVQIIRALEQEVGRPIAILADLQGPKLRLGTFAEGKIALTVGQRLRLDLDPTPGNAVRAPLPHPEIFAALSKGHSLLLDDGKVRLRTTLCGRDFAETVVEVGQFLSDRKGVNVPGVLLPLTPLTPKDKTDLAAALDMGADWIALSFVQRPEDIAEAKDLIGGRAAIMAKLEKPSALDTLEEILELADGVMVARGDLGVEMPPEDVPRLQKRIVRAARRYGKPVIVATQMLESMITNPTPTRAEASDVATAVYDGADAIMLSAESASGAFPVEAVRMMDRITLHTQEDPAYYTGLAAQHPGLQHTRADAITAAARQVVETVGAAAIVTYTSSGFTTLRAARERPHVPILGLTASPLIARQLVLAFGVHAVTCSDITSFQEMVEKALQIAQDGGIVQRGQDVVITAGVPFGTAGSTNILRIARVGGYFESVPPRLKG